MGVFQGPTLGAAEKVVKAVVAALRRVGWDVLAKGDLVLMRSDQMRRGLQQHAGAYYHHQSDVMYIPYPSRDDRDLVERTLHEMGHRLWNKFMDYDQRDTWEESWKALKSSGGSFPTAYASKHHEEDFSESFALWTLGRLPKEHQDRLRAVKVIR